MGTTNIYGSGAQIQTNITDIDALEAGVTVEKPVTGVGGPNVLLATESRKVIVNEATLTALNYQTLPTAAAGMVFTFVVNDTDGMRIGAAASDTIRLDGSVSIAEGYVESYVVGSVIKLVCIDATEWIAITIIGTWAVETS